MDTQQSSLESLQDETTKLDEKVSPGWTSEIQEKIEFIQDKWDALTQIIEVQAQRVRPLSYSLNLTKKYYVEPNTLTPFFRYAILVLNLIFMVELLKKRTPVQLVNLNGVELELLKE